MYKSAVRTMIRRNVRSLARGNPGPLLAGYADDAVLVFPGRSSWGGEHRGKAAIAEFLRRFIDAGLVGEVQEILVNGPPWRTSVSCCSRTRRWTTPARSSTRIGPFFTGVPSGGRSSTKRTLRIPTRWRRSTPISQPVSRRDVAVILHEDERMRGLGQVVGIFLDELFEGGARLLRHQPRSEASTWPDL